MNEALIIGLWLILTCAAVAAAVFITRAIWSEKPVLLGLGRERVSTLGGRIHLIAVVVGWSAIVAVGVHGLLVWLPNGENDYLRLALALIAASSSIYILAQLENAAILRQDLVVARAAMGWASKYLRSFGTPSVVEIQRLEEESRDPTKTDTEQRIAATILGRAKDLKERDERMEAQVIHRLQREQEEKAAKAAELDRKTRIAEEKVSQQAAKDARALAVETALGQQVRTSLTLRDIDGIYDQCEVILDNDLVLASWIRFKGFAARALLPQSEGKIGLLLQELPGVALIDGVEILIHEGSKYGDRYCDAYAIVSGEQLPLRKGIVFEESSEAILNAFFLSAGLPGQWSWGHGFYDRDHELVTSLSMLHGLLLDSPFATPQQVLALDAKWPPTGVRIYRDGNTLEVACLAFRPGLGISDLSMSVTGGKASSLREQTIFIWGQGILY